MSSFYGNAGGSGNNSSSSESKILFYNSTENFPTDGQENILYISKEDKGIYIFQDGEYIDMITTFNLEWEYY